MNVLVATDGSKYGGWALNWVATLPLAEPATITALHVLDVASESYQIARRYMIRLAPEDMADAQTLGRCASVVGLSADAFIERFRSIV